jgi:hypothetical protein
MPVDLPPDASGEDRTSSPEPAKPRGSQPKGPGGSAVIQLDARRHHEDQFAVLVRRALCGQPLRDDATERPRSEVESLLPIGPARTLSEAAPRLRYLLEQFALTLPGQETRHQKLVRRALRDIAVLLDRPEDGL